ncbi:MAG: hypothetical protein ACKN9T_12385 [Candidatus Methylumidiphilus sp.]
MVDLDAGLDRAVGATSGTFGVRLDLRNPEDSGVRALPGTFEILKSSN